MELKKEEYEVLKRKYDDDKTIREHCDLIEDIVLDPKYMYLGSNMLSA